MVFQFQQLHYLVAAITLVGAVDSETANPLMSIPILEDIERWIGPQRASAGGAGVGLGLPTLDAICTVHLPTASGLHRVEG